MPRKPGPPKRQTKVVLSEAAWNFHAASVWPLALGTHIAARLECEYEEALQSKGMRVVENETRRTQVVK